MELPEELLIRETFTQRTLLKATFVLQQHQHKQFRLDIHHMAGKTSLVPNALSQLPTTPTSADNTKAARHLI